MGSGRREAKEVKQEDGSCESRHLSLFLQEAVDATLLFSRYKSCFPAFPFGDVEDVERANSERKSAATRVVV